MMMVAVGKCHFYHTDDKKARKVSVLYVSWVDVRKDFSLWTPCRDAAPLPPSPSSCCTIPILLLRGVQRALLLHTVAHALIRLSQHVPLSVVSPSRSPCRPAERTVSKTHWVIGTVCTKTPFQPLSRYLSFFFLFPCFSSFFVSN